MLTVLRRLFRRIDAVVLCCTLGLSAFSVVLLLGIQQMGVIGRRTVLMQVVAAGLGFIAAMVLAHLDYEQLGSWWKFYVPVAVVLMLLTFTPLGQTRTDSIETNRSWLNLGFTTIQPAEFLKIAFILSLAYHLSKVGASLNGSKTLLRVGAHAICPGLLILLQKDWGVALVMLFIVVVMLIMAGLSCRWILLGCAAAVVFAPLAWFFLLDDYQKIRFVLLKNPEAYALGQAYQQLQGRISFGSGQLFGIGIFSPDHRYVPDMYNDMIFTFIGESVGFLGALAVLLVYGLLHGPFGLRRGLCHARRPNHDQCCHVPDGRPLGGCYPAAFVGRRQLGALGLFGAGPGAFGPPRRENNDVQLRRLFMGEKRFVVLASEGSGFSNAMQEIVDTETGAHYLTWQSGHAGGITPLLGADGKPVITARGMEYDK